MFVHVLHKIITGTTYACCTSTNSRILCTHWISVSVYALTDTEKILKRKEKKNLCLNIRRAESSREVKWVIKLLSKLFLNWGF